MNAFKLLAVGVVLLMSWAMANAQTTSGARPVTDFRLASLQKTCNGSAPVTFGQPFRPGDVPDGMHIAVMDGKTVLPSQADIKARNKDGSVRHAVITVEAPCHLDSTTQLQIVAAPGKSPDDVETAQTLSDVLKTDFDAALTLKLGQTSWHQSARALLQRIAAQGCNPQPGRDGLYCRRWLSGPQVNEWVVGAPPIDADSQSQSQLMVFFAIRVYGNGAIDRVRVDTTIENDWAYAEEPGNQTYDAALEIDGHTVWRVSDLTHYAHARWHQSAWWHAAGPAWFAALNGSYLQATPAIPRYESVSLDDAMLSRVRTRCAPMDNCDVMAHMEATGAQPQIGPLPQWSSAYIVAANDYRAYRWMLANSDALGAYGIHYRDQATGDPLSLDRHPCVTTLGPVAEQARCHAAPHGDDRFPTCHGCETPLGAEPAHHGAPAYVAYLVTGDWFYAQELSFWADWVEIWQNPGYREYRTGLVQKQQVRGQAWGLRTLADAAYALPDDAALKSDFNAYVKNNIAFYTQRYLDKPDANKLGILVDGDAITYPRDGKLRHTRFSTWQMSFFNWSIGNLVDMGFSGADRLRDYFSTMPVTTLTSDGFCPELASAYTLKVRDSESKPFYSDYATVYAQSFPDLSGIACNSSAMLDALQHDPSYDGFPYPTGTMVGYPSSDTGFVANYQIGMASAANSSRPQAMAAWKWFMARPVRPSYTKAPQFAILPTR